MKQIFIILIFIPFTTFCQILHSSNTKKLSIRLTFSPDYSYRTLKPVISDNPTMEIQNQINRRVVDTLNLIEKGKLAFTFGISLTYKLNKRFSLNTGIYYSDKGIKSKGFVYGNGIYDGYYNFHKESYVKSKFYFYEVPVTISYSIDLDSAKKYQTYFILGATFCLNSQKHNFISRRWYNITGDPYSENSYQTMYVDANRIFHIGYIFGLGFSIKATEKVHVIIELVFKYYAYQFYSGKMNNSQNSTQLPISILKITEKPYSLGCNLGLNFGF